MKARDGSATSHHWKLLWRSVGNSASAGCFGSQRIPSVPGCSLNQLNDQKTGRNVLANVDALLRSTGQSSSTFFPAAKAARVDASYSWATVMSEGAAVSRVFG